MRLGLLSAKPQVTTVVSTYRQLAGSRGRQHLSEPYWVAVGKQVGAHALRATPATNALDHKADFANGQERLRHANINCDNADLR